MEKVKKQELESLFVEYKEALALKELGFDESTYNWRQHGNGISGNVEGKRDYYNRKGDVYVALPRYSQVFRWFREKYRLYPIIDSFVGVKGVVKFFYKLPMYDETFDTYEEAESACLNKLIEIIKNK